MAARFFVSTTHSLLAIDLEIRGLWQVHSGSGLYYGLAKGEDGLIYAACRNTIHGPNDETVRAAEDGSILGLDRSFRVVRKLQSPFPLRDVHGIACFNGRLWVTCSFDNMVAIYDFATDEWSRWFPAPHPADRGHDVHHFNTIRKIGPEVCLVAHRFGPSELLFFDGATLRLNRSVSLGAEAHDIFLYGGMLATCSSRDGWLVNLAGKTLRTGHFPRGIAKTSQGTLLGLSEQAGRAQRAAQTGILRWYAPDWCFRADFLLPGAGMVLDIIELAGQDYDWRGLEKWPDAEVTCGEAWRTRASPGVDKMRS